MIINLLYLGDLVFSLPLLKAIKAARPETELILVANSNFIELPRQLDFIDRTLSYNKSWPLNKSFSFAKKLRNLDIPLSLNIHGNWRTALLQRLIATDYRAGYNRSGQRYLYHYHKDWEPGNQHMVEYFLDWLKDLNIKKPENIALPEITPAELSPARKNELGLKNKKYLILNPGGSWPTKRWPVNKFASLADKLLTETDLDIVLTGGPGDLERNKQILAQISTGQEKRLHNTAGRTSIPDLMAITAAAEFMVSGDTGPVHLAALFRTPALTIFGPSAETMYRPYGPEEDYPIIANWGLHCRPCGEHECPLGHHKCLQDLTVKEVFRKIKEGFDERLF
ncbi:MAG: glycosyltransferase family 9 protein [Halanaerobiaceae bacterium]